MGYADRIGNAQPRPTVDDLEKARLARQIEAEKVAEQNPIFASLLIDQIATYIRDGGTPPWELPADAGPPHTYPPIKQHRSAL